MRVLYVTGACLDKNTSANMSHNAFLLGLIENGYQVDVVMSNDSWGKTDNLLKRFEDVTYYEYNSVSLADKLRKRTRTIIQPDQTTSDRKENTDNPKLSVKQHIRAIAKSFFYAVFQKDPVYVNEAKWLKTASKFRSDREYNLVISNSSPAAGHKLVQMLSRKNQIKYNRWIQIWEDPWYYDLYGGFSAEVLDEERNLLKSADEIYYVSPLTLMYQKQYFSDCADKMKCVPLPYLDYSTGKDGQGVEESSFGYFGDYYSATRNLKPFYEALKQSGHKGYIYGDNDLNLKSTDKIEISGRVTLDVLAEIQAKTNVLVHLSNLKGGQIPGKIYHYSATNKPILFILDGTEEEKKALREFFGKYDRYYFCENNEKDIFRAMNLIIREKKAFKPVRAFSPKEVVKGILDE